MRLQTTSLAWPYQLLRRAGFLFARSSGAAGNCGLTQTVRLFGFDAWRDASASLWIKSLRRRVHYRGKNDYVALTSLFTENFYVEPSGFEIRSVLDLGANIGIECLRFWAFYPAAKIIAVEADASNYAVLMKNVAGLEGVSVLHAAVWGKKASLSVRSIPGANLECRVVPAPDAEVRSVTVPDLIDLLGLPEVDIVKIDVEGSEDSLFGPGLENWIGRARILVWELNDHEAPHALSRLVLAMAKAGVRFNFHIRGEKLVAVRSDTKARVCFPCGLLAVH